MFCLKEVNKGKGRPEALVDLRRSVGLTKTEAEVGPYQTTPPEVVAKIQKDFGFVKEALGVR